MVRHRLVADLHCDTAIKLARGRGLDAAGNHVTIDRLRSGGVGLQVFACWISPKYRRQAARVRALELLADVRGAIACNRDAIAVVTDRASWRECRRQGGIGALLAVEGGHACAGSPDVLDELHALGVRILTLTWNNHNAFADSSAHAEKRGRDGGLTDLGRRLVERADALGVTIDLSHSSPGTFRDVLDCSAKPVLVSHSCAMSLRRHHRNLTDGQVAALAAKGGLLGINFYPGFLGDQRDPCGLRSVVDQFVHVRKVAGTGMLAMGSDFDGISKVPQGLDGPHRFPDLLAALGRAGFTAREIDGIAGRNALRFLGWD
ncbi:MAG: dipeptidase [Candidatus Edwardsbacteria bacterium]|nr:dipeptidase [Candidatus Edwardsbacteria bacterium]